MLTCQNSTNSRIKSAIAGFTALSFTLSSMVFPAALTAAPEVSAKSVNIQDFSGLKIPESLAKVETVFDGDEKSQRSVVVIQDAHSIPDAQRSIRKTILFLEKEYGAKLIGVEGASGDLDTRIFQSYPDQEKLQAVFKEYMDKGEMTGSVAAAIFGLKKEMTARGVEFFGIEDWPVYEEGLALYLAAMGEEEKITKQLEVGSLKLEEEKKNAYSPELLEVDSAHIAFEGNSKDLLAYLKALAAVKAPEAGSEIALLLNEADKGQTDESALDAEVRKIAAKVKSNLGKLSSEGQKTFSERFQSFQTSQISAAQFALALKDLSEKEGFKLPMTQGMEHQAFNQRRMRDLEGTKLFKDIEAYTKAIKESLFRNDLERQLDQRTHELILLTKWAKLELSREDWGEIKQRSGKTGEVTDSLSLRSAVGDEAIPDLSPLFKYHRAFYENAEKRDAAFIKNLEKRLRPGEPAIMIAGGFHAQGLAEHLQAKGIDYALVMPNIEKLPEVSAYREHMKGNVDWRSYFEVKNGKINLYEAFVRYTRDKLMGRATRDAPRGTPN
nr:hypothetical protein [Candidatus Omnitrophota bacterium]